MHTIILNFLQSLYGNVQELAIWFLVLILTTITIAFRYNNSSCISMKYTPDLKCKQCLRIPPLTTQVDSFLLEWNCKLVYNMTSTFHFFADIPNWAFKIFILLVLVFYNWFNENFMLSKQLFLLFFLIVTQNCIRKGIWIQLSRMKLCTGMCKL